MRICGIMRLGDVPAWVILTAAMSWGVSPVGLTQVLTGCRTDFNQDLTSLLLLGLKHYDYFRITSEGRMQSL